MHSNAHTLALNFEFSRGNAILVWRYYTSATTPSQPSDVKPLALPLNTLVPILMLSTIMQLRFLH